MITLEMIEDFKRCMDFDYFKSTYAKNHSYVAAMFVHGFVFNQYFKGLVIAEKHLRSNIRDEILSLIKLIPIEFYEDLKINIRKIESGKRSIYFRPIDDNNLKGWLPDLVYNPGLLQNPYYIQTDVLNVYEAIKL